MGSNATVKTSDMELSPVRVTFDGVDLGGTLGNVAVKMKYSLADIKADQSGVTVRNRKTSGFECSIELELTEVLNEANWKKVFPHAELVGTAPNQKIIFKNNIGDSQLALAKLLVLHPLSKDNSDKTADFNFFKAIANADSQIVYSPTDQSRLKLVFNVYPDESTTPERFFSYGDPAIVGTAASFSAAVAGGGNVGNGTVSGIAVDNVLTKTETVTLTAVTAALNGGVFYVEGSVSGPLGLATVGTPFSSGPIDLTINDGSTDFAVGDVFTIATTAAS